MNKGLGKGLGALLAAFDEEEDNIIFEKQVSPAPVPALAEKKVVADAGVLEVDIALIDNNVDQPRKSFDPIQLQELADSIASNGIFQPILVNKVGSRYLIVAGERRWRAAKLAGLATVPVIVRDYSKRQVSEIAIIENLQREDLNDIELARGIKKLMDDHLLTQEKVATALGKSRSSVANTLRLLALPQEVQQMVETGQLSVGHAKCLVAITNADKSIKLAKQCVAERLSVRELEELIRDIHDPEGGMAHKAKAKPQSPELRQIALELTQKLGTKVVLQGDARSGKIVVEYYDRKDLERLYQKLRD